MTYFRISTDDRHGKIKGYVGEGTFTSDPFGMAGGIAVTHVQRLRGLLRHLCREGFEHHVAMVRGTHAGVVAEAVRYLGWELYEHDAPRD
jgi:L-fucose isomerase-like protein